jgi:predicted DNA-binding transcriptional regulator YafY
MAQDIESALGKILSILSPTARASAESLALYAPALALDVGTRGRLQTLREAVQSRNKVRMDYRDLTGTSSQRVVRPIGCFYWGKVWTFSAWCEMREDFRGFRIDRIDSIEVLPERFLDEPDKTLAEMLRRLQADPHARALPRVP